MNEEHDPAFCYELFRRAIVEGDQNAHDCLYQQYQPLVAGWVERHSGFPGSGEEVQYFVNRAFEKLWNAITPEKFSRFPDLKSLLRYLKLCVHSVVVDHGRARRGFTMDEEPMELAALGISTTDNVEADAIAKAQQRDFWRLITERLNDEQERLVIYGSFVLALKPRELQIKYNSTFSDVKDVYRVKQNVLDRLRRDSELKQILGSPA